jgi:hypothetical protein
MIVHSALIPAPRISVVRLKIWAHSRDPLVLHWFVWARPFGAAIHCTSDWRVTPLLHGFEAAHGYRSTVSDTDQNCCQHWHASPPSWALHDQVPVAAAAVFGGEGSPLTLGICRRVTEWALLRRDLAASAVAILAPHRCRYW